MAGEEALMHTPGEIFAHAVQLHQQGDLRAAEALYRQVLTADPANAPALNYLGMIACQLGDFNAAGEFFRRAIRVRPNEYGFYNNLGMVYDRLERPADAITCYEEALRYAPNSPDVHLGIANALYRLDRLDEAKAHLQTALTLRPNYPQAHNNLGDVLIRQGQPEEAVASFQQALRLHPQYADAHNNLGFALKELGRLDEAEAEFTEALRLAPDHVDAHLNRSILQLLRGETEHGWLDYLYWRWVAKRLAQRDLGRPSWDGSPLHGRTILLHSEQGLGETIQFIRFASPVKALGGTVIVQCPAPLLRLLETAPDVDRLVADEEVLPPFDVHAPLLSVPALLNTTLATLPARVPYLRAEPALVEHWRNELASLSGLKVGIAWQGSTMFRTDRQRSVPLARFAPVAAVPGVQLIALQIGPAVDQIRAISRHFQVLDLTLRRNPSTDSFQETAAIMQNLDLIISTDTSVPHLAGALGLPVWLALAHVADWRWLMNRSDSPWYPTMRLFRQPQPGDWHSVFTAIATELQTLVGKR
jgi:Flp pilus assembly protein TadD